MGFHRSCHGLTAEASQEASDNQAEEILLTPECLTISSVHADGPPGAFR